MSVMYVQVEWNNKYISMSPCSSQTDVRRRPGPVCVVTATRLKLRPELCPRSVCQPVQAQPILRHLIGLMRIGHFLITRQYASKGSSERRKYIPTAKTITARRFMYKEIMHIQSGLKIAHFP